MKKKHGIFFGFAVLLIAVILTLAGCDNGGGDDDDPELAKWNGTWKAVDQYLDDNAFDQMWTDAVSAIKGANSKAVVDVATLKAVTKQMLRTDFKSCAIEGNTMKIYDNANATGSPTATWNYTYSGIRTVPGEGEEEDQEWLKFTGDKEGQFKYLILAPKHRDDPDAMLHFHLLYSADSFEAATADLFWEAMVTPTTTTIAQIVDDISGFPWALYADFFVPQN
jgi:Zn/Cd-binding protein ZinT